MPYAYRRALTTTIRRSHDESKRSRSLSRICVSGARRGLTSRLNYRPRRVSVQTFSLLHSSEAGTRPVTRCYPCMRTSDKMGMRRIAMKRIALAGVMGFIASGAAFAVPVGLRGDARRYQSHGTDRLSRLLVAGRRAPLSLGSQRLSPPTSMAPDPRRTIRWASRSGTARWSVRTGSTSPVTAAVRFLGGGAWIHAIYPNDKRLKVPTRALVTPYINGSKCWRRVVRPHAVGAVRRPSVRATGQQLARHLRMARSSSPAIHSVSF
jgi:hypothetical protein